MELRKVEPTAHGVKRIGLFLVKTFALEAQIGPMRTRNIASQRAADTIMRTLQDGSAWTVEHSGEIVGSIGVFPDRLWWSDVDYLADRWFYVAPEKRGSSAAMRLLKAAEDHAREAGLPLMITMGHTPNLEAKEQMMKRRGFQRAGAVFGKE